MGMIANMLGKTYENQVCSIARALEVVGERWSLLIIRNALFAGSTRYSDFQRSLGIATNVLKSRLDGFVDAGIMRRQQYSDQPELYEYLLTEKGRDLAPALIALTQWGDRWAAPAPGGARGGAPPPPRRSSIATPRAAMQSAMTSCARRVAGWMTRPRSPP